jgi:cobalt-zinc-cadmium efflux system membrane fusion protein
MKNLTHKASLVVMGVIISLSSCTLFNKPVEETVAVEVIPEDIVELRQDQISLAGIKTGEIEIRKVNNTLKVNGIISVSPQSQATVSMPMGGFVKSTSLLPGNAISKGQTLAVIENQDFVDIQVSFLEAKNNLGFAEAEYKRHTDLYKDDVYSEKSLQQVTVEYKNLLAKVKSLEQKLILIGIDPGRLNETNISSTVNLVSPISGYLKSVNINIGKYVSPTDVLFEVVNNDKLFLELTLFEKDADKITKGQKVKFYVNNSDEEYEAIITQTGKSVNNDRTFKVFASVSGSSENLLPGMYVNASIEDSEVNTTALPSESIVSFDDKDYIFTFEKDKVEAGNPFTEYRIIEVTKGVSSDGYTQVSLPEGFNVTSAKVVIQGAYNLLSAKKNAGEMAC